MKKFLTFCVALVLICGIYGYITGGVKETSDTAQTSNADEKEADAQASEKSLSQTEDPGSDDFFGGLFTDEVTAKVKNTIIDEYGHTFDQAVAKTVTFAMWSHWPSFDGMEYVKLTGYIGSTPFELVFIVGTKDTVGKTATVPRSGGTEDFIIDVIVKSDEDGNCYIVPFNKKYDTAVGKPYKDLMPFSAKFDGEDVKFEKCLKICEVICANGTFELTREEKE